MAITIPLEKPGRPMLYDLEAVARLIDRGQWASWKTLVRNARDSFNMSPSTLSRYLIKLRKAGVFTRHDGLYHRFK